MLVTGITAQIGTSPQRAAIAMLEAARGLRVVDPNFRRGLWGSDRRVELVLPLIERCDLLLAGDQELKEVFGDSEPEELARRCAQLGPREIVVRCESKVGVFRKDGSWTRKQSSPRKLRIRWAREMLSTRGISPTCCWPGRWKKHYISRFTAAGR